MPQDSDSRVIDLTIRIGFLALFIYGTLMLVAPLFGLMLWAVILGVAVYPLHALLTRWLGGRPKTSATLLTLIGLAITLGPVALLGAEVVDLGVKLYDGLANGTLKLPPPRDELLDWPLLGPQIHAFWTRAHQNIAETLAQVAPVVLPTLQVAAGKLAGLGIDMIALALSVIIMGALLVIGGTFVDYTRRFAERVVKGSGAGMVDMAGATVRNVSRGVIGVAVIQSLLAGILMTTFGVPAAGPLALVALVLCVVQIGPALVLIPVIIWAWTAMGTGQAVLFTALVVPVMLIDNVLKPLWMSRGLDTPMLVILIGVLGGLMAFGMVGLFVGPVILSVFHQLFVHWIDQDPAITPARSGEG